MRDDPSPQFQDPAPKVRLSLYQRVLIRVVRAFGHEPEIDDPPKNTFIGWFRFIGMLTSGLAMLGISIWWIASGEYTDANHTWHNQVTRGIQVPLYVGAIGLFGTFYALTIRPWKAPSRNTDKDA